MSEPYYEDDLVTLLHGNALVVASGLAPKSVQTIVTSPPYFGLRDYESAEQFGAEETVEEFVRHLVDLFAVLRTVLADDGTLWLNLGDSYSSEGGKSGVGVNARVGNTLKQVESRTRPASDLPAKNLIGVPWRVALALQADGWILRSDIIWAKPNPMPESVTDRPTKSHEHLFLFAKSSSYLYDSAAIAEDAAKGDAGTSWTDGKTGDRQQGRSQVRPSAKQGDFSGKGKTPGSGQQSFRAVRESRNKRDVWSVATVPFPGAHFAAYPPQLIRPCILAGSRPGDTVLDPFSGSGTTGMVATEEGRKYIGIDLNREYLDLSLSTRFAQPPLSMKGIA